VLLGERVVEVLIESVIDPTRKLGHGVSVE
jgi:hypothetical protein